MTVAELCAALDALPAGAQGWAVVLSRDGEGNAFSPLRDCIIGLYRAVPARGVPAAQGIFASALDLDAHNVGWYANAVSLWPVR